MDKKLLHIITFTLVLVGALNWGLVGLFNFNLVTLLFGFMPLLVTVVYVLIGLSAVYVAFSHKNDCKICGKK